MYNHIPDLCLLGLGAAAVASAWLWPWAVVLPGWLRLVGGAFVVAAALVIGAVLGALRRAATSTNPVDEPTALLTSGPFALSRNPLYLAYVLAVLGCALQMILRMSSTTGECPVRASPIAAPLTVASRRF